MAKRRIDDTRSRLLQTLQDDPALPALLRKLQPIALGWRTQRGVSPSRQPARAR